MGRGGERVTKAELIVLVSHEVWKMNRAFMNNNISKKMEDAQNIKNILEQGGK